MSLVVVKSSSAEVTVGQGLLKEVTSVELVPRVLNLKQTHWNQPPHTRIVQYAVFLNRVVEEATDQHRVHIHIACLQVLAHGGDLVVGQVRRVVLVQLQ